MINSPTTIRIRFSMSLLVNDLKIVLKFIIPTTLTPSIVAQKNSPFIGLFFLVSRDLFLGFEVAMRCGIATF